MPLVDPASVQAQTLRGDWEVFFVAAALVTLVMFVLILLPVILWRGRDAALPPQFASNRAMSYVYILTPLAIVIALFAVTYVNERSVDALVAKPQTTVEVTGFRWSWRFAYPAGGITVVGTPEAPPTLVLPLRQTVRIELTSSDVDHAFWIPDFLFKRDAIAGMTNRFDLTPTRLGTFRGVCAEFCGLDHALMTFRVRVVPAANYRRWLASKGRIAP